MALSKDFFIDTYIKEAQDYINSFTENVVLLKNNPEDFKTITQILRTLHTLKGSSRMLDFKNVELLTHSLEEVFKGLRENAYEFSQRLLKLLLITSEKIAQLLKKIKSEHNDKEDISFFVNELDRASKGLFFDIENLEKINKGNLLDLKEDKNNKEDDDTENLKTIEIPLSKIDSVIEALDSILIKQFKFKHQLDNFEKEFSKINSGKLQLTKQLKEEVKFTEESIIEVQHNLLNLRMLSLNTILKPLKLSFESEAELLSKKIFFDIEESDFLMDKVILEKLKEILIHLLRNSIDHGIESEEERISKGKSREGKIFIYIKKLSNHLVITVGDDGKGLDYKKIKKKAEALYPEEKKEITSMSDKDLIQYLFLPGFTTRDSSSKISGRGIGLDVVKYNMEKIKGKLQIFSEENRGTSFKLTIPFSLTLEKGIFIKCGSEKYMIPSHYIHEITEADEETLITKQGQDYIIKEKQQIPLYSLSSLLKTEKSENDKTIIILEYLDSKIAVIVSAIEQYENIVTSPLPKIMKNSTSLQALVYDENYSIIPVLNIPDTMQRLKNLLAYDIKKIDVKNKKKSKTILIADDSLSTRQIEESIFERKAFNSISVSDGIEAISMMKKYSIDLFVIDINMPRMDGKTLLNNIRRSEEYKDTPVIIITGACDKKSEEDFIKSGAQAFILKSEFERGMLLKTAGELLNER